FGGKTIYPLAFWVAIGFIINFSVSYCFLIVFAFKLWFMRCIVELIPYIIIGLFLCIFVYIYQNIFKDSMYLFGLCKLLYITFIYVIGMILTGQSKVITKFIKSN